MQPVSQTAVAAARECPCQNYKPQVTVKLNTKISGVSFHKQITFHQKERYDDVQVTHATEDSKVT